MLHTIIFIGRSGCGKGTQADLLKEYIAKLDPKKRQILYVATGEHFRKFIRGKNFSSELSRDIYEKGERQPDFLACWLWANMLIEELMPDMHLVFDGAPRSYFEAAILSTALRFYQRVSPTVIYLKVRQKWAQDRLLSRGRQDDRTLLKINKRLDWFETDTQPAIEYFRTNKLYRFIEVNGEQTIQKVHSDIISRYESTN